MSSLLDDFNDLKLYNKALYAPVNDDDRKHGSVLFLLTPSLSSSLDFIQTFYNKRRTKVYHGEKKPADPNTIMGSQNFESYYMEKDISYVINNESHTLSRSGDRLILEDGDLTLQKKVKGTLSEFKRVDIDPDTLDEALENGYEVTGVVPYEPWTGYFYYTEDDKLVACLNMNVEERQVEKLFVTEEKYNYLYKELIQEARNCKMNEINVRKDTSLYNALLEFGFSSAEELDGICKMRYKVAIEEDVLDNRARKLRMYLESNENYKLNTKYDTELTYATVEGCMYYADRMNLDKETCYLMSRLFRCENYKMALTDIRLLKYMKDYQIQSAIMAIINLNSVDIKESLEYDIYTRVLHDSELLAHWTDIDVIIMDEVNGYYEENNLNRDPQYLYIDEVDEIIDGIEKKHKIGTKNDFFLNISYTYYRKKRNKVNSAIKKKLRYKIIDMYKVTVNEEYNPNSADIIHEAHMSFGYEKETFETENQMWEDWKDKITHEQGFINRPAGKTRGIIISGEGKIRAVIKVDELNNLCELATYDIDPGYLLMVASRKFGANKVAIPEDCSLILDRIKESKEWEPYIRKDHKIIYSVREENANQMVYPDVGIKEEAVNVFNKLTEQERYYLGYQYENPICVSNTIYSKAYDESALVDVYILPEFPKIGWIDIAVVEGARRKGFGTMIVKETIDVMKKQYPKLDMLGWTCRTDNEGSNALARKTGFIPYSEKNGYRHYMFNIHNQGGPISNTFVEETDYTDDITISSSNIDLSECVNMDGTYMLLDEDANRIMTSDQYKSKFRAILWEDRIKNNKKVLEIYDNVKKVSENKIRYTYINLDLYKRRNLFVDLSFYNVSFFNNYTKAGKDIRRHYDLYFEIMRRLINDSRIKKLYNKRTVIIPIKDWCFENLKKDDKSYLTTRKLDYVENLNPLSTFLFMSKRNPTILKSMGDVDFLIMDENNKFFKINFSKYDPKKDFVKFKLCCEKLLSNEYVERDYTNSKKVLIHKALDQLEQGNRKITINSITTDVSDTDTKQDREKKELVKEIEKAAAKTNNVPDLADEMDNANNAEYTQKILRDIENNENGSIKLSVARTKRLDGLNEKFLNSKDIDTGYSVKDYMIYDNWVGELPETEIPIESINECWSKMQYTNFEKEYSLRADIYSILHFICTRSVRISLVGEPKIEDTSTTEDWKETWTCKFEDANGKRFTFKFDIPILKDNRYMVLGGNDKSINGQLVLLPVSKTDNDTAQIVSNYNKIFVRRYSVGNGKSTIEADIFSKAVEIYAREHPNDIKIKYGDNTNVNIKYDLPFDYMDLASKYYSIKLYDKGKLCGEIYFNQDNCRKDLNIKDDDDDLYIGWGMNEGEKKIYKFTNTKENANSTCAAEMLYLIACCVHNQEEFARIRSEVKPANKHTYSRASILAEDIPIIVIMAYSEGLIEALKKGHVDYTLSEKRSNDLKMQYGDVIKFKDAFLYYKTDYNASLLMNGLKEIDTENYSIQEVDNKAMWTEALDNYGGRLKADGLDNFHDLMMDPITTSVCDMYQLPTDYCEMLAYSNLLLADSSYIKHTNLNSNRFRTNELIAAHTYKCISKAYANYKNQIKRDRSVVMTMKQSAILDALMEDPTMSDYSVMNPNNEIESKNSVSFKGIVGMNSDRSYSLDKRTYDETMVNKIAMSTGFSQNVGVNRQTTINMQIKGRRGLIKNSNIEDCNVANTLSMTEALTPFGSTRDDPFRTAMTNIQTSKHNMRINKGYPLLVSCGADYALPYLTGDTFSFKAKASGKVVKATKDYLIVEYDKSKNRLDNTTPAREIIDLRENTKKNSDGGFYVTVKLDSNLKKGSRFKANDILAYDRCVYNNDIGDGKHISYNIGALGNIAIANTDEGFEDSAAISERLAGDLTSEIVVQISKNLPANTNVFNICSVGDVVQEGDTLMLYQSPFEEEDANDLVKKLSMDSKEVTELGRIPIKSKVTGVVQDIKIYRTVDYNELSSSLRKLFKEYDARTGEIRKEADRCDNRIDIEPDYKLPATSKMKNLEGKVKIEFYVKYNDRMGVGDKLVFMSAIKGVLKTLIPDDEAMYTERRPDEMVDALCSAPSLNHRMVASVKILVGLNKGVVELNRYMKEAVGLKYEPYNPRNKK